MLVPRTRPEQRARSRESTGVSTGVGVYYTATRYSRRRVPRPEGRGGREASRRTRRSTPRAGGGRRRPQSCSRKPGCRGPALCARVGGLEGFGALGVGACETQNVAIFPTFTTHTAHTVSNKTTHANTLHADSCAGGHDYTAHTATGDGSQSGPRGAEVFATSSHVVSLCVLFLPEDPLH